MLNKTSIKKQVERKVKGNNKLKEGIQGKESLNLQD